MIKKLITLGEGLAIYFTKKEIELFGLIEGDKLDLSNIFLTQVKGKKGGRQNDKQKSIKRNN